MKVLIIGGSGYIGTNLCNYLIQKKIQVTSLDTFWFGDYLNKRVKKIKADIRVFDFDKLQHYDAVINLAYLSNDPSCAIDARGTWEIGPLALYRILEFCKKIKTKKFIFASSGSVYGVKNKNLIIKEDVKLEPLTDYNKSKMICEKVVESYNKFFDCIIVRPATVCGYSPRLRLDVVLNLFCYQAYFKKKITILGGAQTRPLVNIHDMIRCYEFFLRKKLKGCFNLGFENKSVREIANSVKKIIPCKLTSKSTDDIRSYNINSNKILKIGFKPLYNSTDAIIEIKKEFDNGFKPNDKNFNLKWLLKRKIIYDN